MSDSKDDVISFDKYILENELNNDMNKIYEIKENLKFSLLPSKHKKNENQKYYVDIQNKKEHYIGVLTTKFEKDLFGYISLNKGDEYLGQISGEVKHGFGVYKFKSDNKDGQDIYIGHFSKNSIDGEGIYINELQLEIKNKSLNVIKCTCHMGLFKDGKFIKGKIYTIDNNFEKLVFQEDENKEKDLLLKGEEKEIINFQKKNDIYVYNKGIMKEKRLIRGSVISVKENDEIKNSFSYKLKNNLLYEYEYLNDEKTKELLKDYKNSNYNKYKYAIQSLLKSIDEMIDNLKKNFDYGRELNFDNFKDYFAEKYNFLISID
jgi:hypothetical protein